MELSLICPVCSGVLEGSEKHLRQMRECTTCASKIEVSRKYEGLLIVFLSPLYLLSHYVTKHYGFNYWLSIFGILVVSLVLVRINKHFKPLEVNLIYENSTWKSDEPSSAKTESGKV